MKKLLIASSLLLLGAGCAQQNDTYSPTVIENPQGWSMRAEVEEIPSGEEEAAPKEEMPTSPAQETAPPAIEVTMDSGNFFFAPNTLTVAPGQKVDVMFKMNDGFHTFVIDEIGFKQSVRAGATISFTAPTTPGTYSYYCDVGSHRAHGMEGTLIVQ